MKSFKSKSYWFVDLALSEIDYKSTKRAVRACITKGRCGDSKDFIRCLMTECWWKSVKIDYFWLDFVREMRI